MGSLEEADARDDRGFKHQPDFDAGVGLLDELERAAGDAGAGRQVAFG